MAGRSACTAEAAAAACRAGGFGLEPAQAEALAGYLTLLMKWNAAMNLVGAATWRGALEDLVMDSFHLADFLKGFAPAGAETWDLGAGAGLPGIPLRMVWQEGSYWLVESRQKRALFLSTVLARHPLPRTFVFRGRAEDFMRGKKADIIVSRAFMPLDRMLELTGGFLKPEGRVVFLRREPAVFPAPWQDAGMAEYTVHGEKRFLCAARRLP